MSKRIILGIRFVLMFSIVGNCYATVSFSKDKDGIDYSVLEPKHKEGYNLSIYTDKILNDYGVRVSQQRNLTR